MTAMRAQLVATAEALFASTPDWAAIEAAGFVQLLVPEADGGFGGDWGDCFAVLQVAGACALVNAVALRTAKRESAI